MNSQNPKVIIRISTSVGAMQRSRCRPKIKGLHENDFIRATKSTAYSFARPPGERVLAGGKKACAARLCRDAQHVRTRRRDSDGPNNRATS